MLPMAVKLRMGKDMLSLADPLSESRFNGFSQVELPKGRGDGEWPNAPIEVASASARANLFPIFSPALRILPLLRKETVK